MSPERRRFIADDQGNRLFGRGGSRAGSLAFERHPEGAEGEVVELAEIEDPIRQFAWKAVKHVKSNAIVFVDQEATSGALRTVAIGAGQMSRVDSVALCRMKARRPLAHTVAASDAFFPFLDGVELLQAAGATAIVQPGGSIRDAEVIAAANAFGLAMIFTGQRHFRH